jgi:hypothetical protein
VPMGCTGLRLARATADAKNKFALHLGKLGLSVLRMLVRRTPAWQASYRPSVGKHGHPLYLPTSRGMRPDHPFYEPDKDRYVIDALCTHRPVTHKIETDDPKLIAHGLARGWRWIDG